MSMNCKASYPSFFGTIILISYLYRRGNQFDQALGKAMDYACKAGAIKCVTHIINGKTPPIFVDIHSPCYQSMFPLHLASQAGHPGITELLLYHGARTDVRCNYSEWSDHDPDDLPPYLALCRESMRHNWSQPSDHPGKLPLHLALNALWNSVHISDWDHNWKKKNSIAQLLIIFCLPFMQNLLETIRLLAWKTEGTKEEFLHYARNGQVVEFAGLLVVGRKMLLDSPAAVEELKGYISTQSNALVGENDKRTMLDLLDVFVKAGDEIDAYIKKDKLNVAKLQVVSQVTCLLQQAGFHVHCNDPEISAFQRGIHRTLYALDSKYFYTPKVAEIGMPHYSTSSYRWAVSGETEHYKFKPSNLSAEKVENCKALYFFLELFRWGEVATFLFFVFALLEIVNPLTSYTKKTESVTPFA